MLIYGSLLLSYDNGDSVLPTEKGIQVEVACKWQINSNTPSMNLLIIDIFCHHILAGGNKEAPEVIK